jgi:hypothetical protein
MYECAHCKDEGYTIQRRYIRGYKAIHNKRVRNYRGGPRPKSTDLKEEVYVACPYCEAGEEFKKMQKSYI